MSCTKNVYWKNYQPSFLTYYIYISAIETRVIVSEKLTNKNELLV